MQRLACRGGIDPLRIETHYNRIDTGNDLQPFAPVVKVRGNRLGIGRAARRH